MASNERATGDSQPRVSSSAIDTAAWRHGLSAAWMAQVGRLEAMLAPVDDPLLRIAAPMAGEAVVDVGCGRGVTTRRAAALVGPSGRAIGLDVSAELIEAARSLGSEADGSAIEWVAADAATVSLDPPVDLVVSRFGVMFFEDPVAAFDNLRRSTRPEGRLAVAVWLPRNRSEFQRRSLDIAVAAASRLGIELRLPEPVSGPFRYGDIDWFGNVLGEAGWVDVQAVESQLDLYVGGPGTSPAEAAALGMGNGPLAMLTARLDAPARVEIERAVALDLEQAWDGTGVRLNAGISIVTARRPRSGQP
jgi:SAM-dependent methyltransferase